MAITFPAAPTNGQVYTDTTSGQSWTFDGVKWKGASSTAYWKRTGTTLAPKTAGDVVNISAGTAALPGLTPVGDANSGLFSPGPDQLAVSTGGSEKLRIDPSGRLLVGTPTSVSQNIDNGTVAPQMQIAGINQPTSTLSIVNYFSGGRAANLALGSSRGGITGTQKIVEANASLGRVSFTGSDGSTLFTAAEILAKVDGTPGANDMPGRIVFSTTAKGASLPTPRMTIGSTGNVEINAAAATSPFIAKVNSAEVARIDPSGKLLVGTSSTLNNYEMLQVNSKGPANVLGLYRQVDDVSGPRLNLAKTRGSETSIVRSGDRIAEIRFLASDGVDTISAGAIITAFVDGTPGVKSIPGALTFSTTGTGENVSTERMRISPDSTIGLGNTVVAPGKPVFKMTLKASGILNLANVPIYTDIAAAQAGGLVAGDVFRNTASMLVIVS